MEAGHTGIVEEPLTFIPLSYVQSSLQLAVIQRAVLVAANGS